MAKLASNHSPTPLSDSRLGLREATRDNTAAPSSDLTLFLSTQLLK
jgi:hypothetical protein